MSGLFPVGTFFASIDSAEVGPIAFACRTTSLSPTSITLAAPELGQVGQGVTLLLEHVGLLKGVVARRITGGFQMHVVGTARDRDKLAAKIGWLKKHRLRKTVDRREAPRKLPRVPSAHFYLEDGTEHACFLIDISRSGAGASAYMRPEIGTSITLGNVAAIVVRHMETGFGVAFRDNPPGDSEFENGLRARRAKP